MSEIAGTYQCVTKSPMGEQESTLTVVPGPDGNTFTGTVAGANGTNQVEEGKIDGNTLSWIVNMTSPMPIKLESEATVDGNQIKGETKAGVFGKMAMTGTKTA